jgi:hypothetical protein
MRRITGRLGQRRLAGPSFWEHCIALCQMLLSLPLFTDSMYLYPRSPLWWIPASLEALGPDLVAVAGHPPIPPIPPFAYSHTTIDDRRPHHDS